MASDYLLVLDGVTGESIDTTFAGAIEIQSFSWSVVNSGSSNVGTGAGVGKASFNDMSFGTMVNKSTPKMILNCALGTKVATAVLHLRKQGDGQQEYLTYTLTDCVVSSVSHGGSGNGEVSENFSLNYTKFEITYVPQKADQSMDTAVSSGYDMKKTAKV